MGDSAAPQSQVLEEAERSQRQASDPAVSAWVRANAGTGKTHVLVQRILRLLLAGAAPRSILCLTFTKNAAAEMEARVLARLGEWAIAAADELSGKLSGILARPPRDGEMALARSLFATVVDGGGGLPIMTIHGLCERILRRYGLEAGVSPGFAVLSEEQARELLANASAAAFSSAREGALREALDIVVTYASERDFAGVLQAMLAKRAIFVRALKVSGTEGIETLLRGIFGIGRAETADDVKARMLNCVPADAIERAIAVLDDLGASARQVRERLRAVLAAPSAEEKLKALKAVFATSKGEPRKTILSAAAAKQEPALDCLFREAQAKFLADQNALCAIEVCKATAALYVLAEAIFRRYSALKSERGALDFDDLIEKTVSLLLRGETAQWVLYQLDGRIDHILIDEAQDTSPEQWAIVEALTSEFFAGEGARETAPTLFAVGDEKQSIYGFQGAVPELLAKNCSLYCERAKNAGMEWRTVELSVSFRTLGPILEGVDRVCARLPGFDPRNLVPHKAYRAGAGGFIELWEPERGERSDKGTVWDTDEEEAASRRPAEALAIRIAAKIERWLADGEVLPSTGRRIEPGDIVVLLRKREPMAGLIEKALKRRGIPVAGADRVALVEEIAVMDLLALADALLQPEDDLSLACVLKGPLMELSEDDLFELAHPRKGSLANALEAAAAAGDARFAPAAEKLACWRDRALRLSAFDFFALILEGERGREAFAARLGPQCLDAIDEFLNLAQSYVTNERGSVADFAAFVRRSASEVKRETEQTSSEVRIMTVHGAKGLEANVVILADCCSVRGGASPPVYVLEPSSVDIQLPVWAVKGSSSLPPIRQAKDKLKLGEERELGRLLYVAMTRARDRLHIAGSFTGSMPEGCWYRTMETALGPVLSEVVDENGERVRRAGEALPAAPRLAPNPRRIEKPPFFEFASPAPEQAASILSPSQLVFSDFGGGAAKRHPGKAAPREIAQRFEGRGDARAAGTFIHALLELLPHLPEPLRERAAKAIARASELSAQEQETATASALSLLGGLHFGKVAASRSFAEAELGLLLSHEDGKPYARLLGKVDRIGFDEGPMVFDYKSRVRAPDGSIAAGYVRQLSCYAAAVERIHGMPVRAALVDLSTHEIVSVSPEMLKDEFDEILRARKILEPPAPPYSGVTID